MNNRTQLRSDRIKHRSPLFRAIGARIRQAEKQPLLQRLQISIRPLILATFVTISLHVSAADPIAQFIVISDLHENGADKGPAAVGKDSTESLVTNSLYEAAKTCSTSIPEGQNQNSRGNKGGTIVELDRKTKAIIRQTETISNQTYLIKQQVPFIEAKTLAISNQTDVIKKQSKALEDLAEAEQRKADAIAAGEPQPDKKDAKLPKRIGQEMKDAERYLDQYGSISISIPLLAPPQENFNFNLNRGATNYYTDAKTEIQGAAASFVQTVQSFGFGAQGQFDPTVAASYAAQLQNYFSTLQRYNTKQNLMDQAAQQQLQANLAIANTNTDQTARSAAIAHALQQYSQAYNAPSNAPSFPTAADANTNMPSVSSDLVSRPSVTNVLNSQTFPQAMALLSGLGTHPTVNDRSAIIQAAGDIGTESIFRHFIGNPNLTTNSAEDHIYFGLSTVSVEPGWETKKGWAAEVSMTAEFYYATARLAVVKQVFPKFATNTVIAAGLYRQYGNTDLNVPQDAIDLSNAYDNTNEISMAEIQNLNMLFTNLQSRLPKNRLPKNKADEKQTTPSTAQPSPLENGEKTEAAAASDIYAYIVNRLQPATLLSLSPTNSTPPTNFEQLITIDLNKIISGVPIYDVGRFPEIATNDILGAKLADLLRTNTVSAVNRMLLETRLVSELRSDAHDGAVTNRDFLNFARNFPRVETIVETNTYYIVEFGIRETRLLAAQTAPLSKRFPVIVRNPERFVTDVNQAIDSGSDQPVSLGAETNQVVEAVRKLKTASSSLGITNFGTNYVGHEPLTTAPITLLKETNLISRPVIKQLPPAYVRTEQPTNTYPVPVTIISPLVDADVLDLSSSSRSQAEFALALSFALRYAGMNGQAKAFEQFVKNKQFDINTRTSEVAVSAFSGADGRFGFQVGPRLQALTDPGGHKNKSGNILSRQSFPALLILALDAVDLQPLLYQTKDGKIIVLEPALRFTQMRRWVPLNHYYSRDWAGFRYLNPKKWFNPEISEQLRLQAASELFHARATLEKKHGLLFSSTAEDTIAKRISNLEAQVVGANGSIFLATSELAPPPAPKPATFAAVTSVVPDRILLSETNSSFSLVFLGTGLEQVQTGPNTSTNLVAQWVPAGEGNGKQLVDTNSLEISKAGQVLQLKGKLSQLPTNNTVLVFKLFTTNTPKQELLTMPVTLSPAGYTPPLKDITMTYAITNGVGTKSYTVTLSTNAADSQLSAAKEIIKSQLEQNKPSSDMSSNTVLNIRVNDIKGANLGVTNTTTTTTGGSQK